MLPVESVTAYVACVEPKGSSGCRVTSTSARMSSALYGSFLNDMTSLRRVLVIAHGEVTLGASPGCRYCELPAVAAA